MRTVGRWITAAWELLIRNPTAGRFLIFQDDVVLCRGVREYLDGCAWPDRAYLNLHTHGPNERVARGKADGWHRGHPNNDDPVLQIGYGAAALAFTREGLEACLRSEHLQRKIRDVGLDTQGSPGGKPKHYADGGVRLMGNVRIDGAIVTAMNLAGWSEWVHNPSLAEHVGDVSSMGAHRYQPTATFRGEQFNAMSLLEK
jgi:hypothetical protein